MDMNLKDTAVSYLWVLFFTYITALDASIEEVERHLEMGKQFLAKGQFADALTHYHAAVDLDPENYQTLYRRATVYLATGRSKAAVPDLDRVIELKPDFVSARLQRGNVLLKQGDLDGAIADFKTVLKSDPSHAEAQKNIEAIPRTKEQIESAEDFVENGDLNSAATLYSQAIDLCPWDASLRAARADIYEKLGDIGNAIADVRASTKLVQDSTEVYLKLSRLFYFQGDAEESLTQIRECLKLNPDHKECFPHYKKVKKLVKQLSSMREFMEREEWDSCIEKAEQVMKTEPENQEIHHQVDTSLCRCYMKAGHSEEAIDVCSEVLESEEDNVNVICDRAEAYIMNEQFDDAIHDYKTALKFNEEHRRAREGLQRAEKLLKQASRKDYYKILGVKRNANKGQITKAYRKLAQKWHPDNFQDEKEKKKAEAKFLDIAAAKEVLTDKEKREKFDNGEDPLDPEQQQQQHAHPFYGFNPFGGGGGGGGPFTFKFHYQCACLHIFILNLFLRNFSISIFLFEILFENSI